MCGESRHTRGRTTSEVELQFAEANYSPQWRTTVKVARTRNSDTLPRYASHPLRGRG